MGENEEQGIQMGLDADDGGEGGAPPENSDEQGASGDAPEFQGLFSGEAKLLAEAEAEMKAAEAEEAEKKGQAGKKETPPAPPEKGKDKKGEGEAPPGTEEKSAESRPKDGEIPKKEEKPADGPRGEKKDSKPPDRHVPIAALHEERSKRQAAQQEIETLKADVEHYRSMVEELKAGKSDEPELKKPEFEYKSDDDLAELYEDDPEAHSAYLRAEHRHEIALMKYERELEKQEAAKGRKTEAENREKSIVGLVARSIGDEFPELFDQKSDLNARLTRFALESGVSDTEALELMTRPDIKYLDPKTGTPRILGNKALGNIRFLKELYDKVQAADPEKVREQVLAEETEKIRKEVTAQVTRELTDKFKKGQGTDFTDIGDIPGGQENELDAETEIMNLSEDKVRRLMATKEGQAKLARLEARAVAGGRR